MTMFTQLGEQDAGYLYLETPETPQHVGSVSFVELPAGYEGDFFAEYKKHIASRLHLNPLMFRKLLPLPFDIDHPFWVDDDRLDIDYHVRRHTLPRPGRLSQLEELVGRIHSNFLDRSRPLWEFYVIDGLEDGRIAIYSKIHHAAMDGKSSQTLIGTLYDPTPVPRVFPPAPPRSAPKNFDLTEMLRGIGTHIARQEIRALQFVPDALKVWARLALPDAKTLNYDKPALPPLITPRTLFNVGITSQRIFAARTMSLSRVKKLGKALDCKVNDVVLAIVAGALRRYLQDHDALPKRPMTAMVPVALHTPGEEATANQNAALLCGIATDQADPVQRLLSIRDAMVGQKRMLSNVKNVLLPDLSFVGSGALVRAGVDLYRRAKLADTLPPPFNLVISNVPGPPVPLYICGARVLSFHPCSIPFHSTALNITIESYVDSLDFGLIACRRTVPDLPELADRLQDALVELEEAVARHAAPPAPPAPEKEKLPAPARPRRTRRTAVRSTGATRTTTPS